MQPDNALEFVNKICNIQKIKTASLQHFEEVKLKKNRIFQIFRSISYQETIFTH